jgi:DMSO/TMAO reductase YedYZ molybdopterin-dependent catalytic subunit
MLYEWRIKFSDLHVGGPPVFSLQTWKLQLVGEVDHPLTLTWEKLSALPSLASVSDFHGVTSWSRADNRWKGVAFRTLTTRQRR